MLGWQRDSECGVLPNRDSRAALDLEEEHVDVTADFGIDTWILPGDEAESQGCIDSDRRGSEVQTPADLSATYHHKWVGGHQEVGLGVDFGPDHTFQAHRQLKPEAKCDQERTGDIARPAARKLLNAVSTEHEVRVRVLAEQLRQDGGAHGSGVAALAGRNRRTVRAEVDVPVRGILREARPNRDV